MRIAKVVKASAGVSAGAGDFRGYLPRFTGRIVRGTKSSSLRSRNSPQRGRDRDAARDRLGLARNARIVPVIGARTRAQLEESLGALDVVLSPEELARIEDAVPASDVAGARYDEHQMRILDSER